MSERRLHLRERTNSAERSASVCMLTFLRCCAKYRASSASICVYLCGALIASPPRACRLARFPASAGL
eukprot:3008459-Pleurochrysis_carterae.AAC.1